MLKKVLIAVVLLVVFSVVIFIFSTLYIYRDEDYKTAIYTIDGNTIQLGVETKYFGNEVRADLNNDGREDVVFLITHQPGGSGTFFYVVAALNTERGYVGSAGVLLGDRIAPQTTEVRPNNIILVNYADRAPGEPFTARPSVGKSIWLKLDPETMQFGEVAQNFEGESDKSVSGFGGEVSAYNVRIFPTELLEDSRCPADVQCVWAGRLSVSARLVSGLGESPRQEFVLGEPVTTEAEVITLVEVLPAPKAGVSIAPSEYRFRFDIQKR